MSLASDDLSGDPEQLLQHLRQMSEVAAMHNARIVALEIERDTALARVCGLWATA